MKTKYTEIIHEVQDLNVTEVQYTRLKWGLVLRKKGILPQHRTSNQNVRQNAFPGRYPSGPEFLTHQAGTAPASRGNRTGKGTMGPGTESEPAPEELELLHAPYAPVVVLVVVLMRKLCNKLMTWSRLSTTNSFMAHPQLVTEKHKKYIQVL